MYANWVQVMTKRLKCDFLKPMLIEYSTALTSPHTAHCTRHRFTQTNSVAALTWNKWNRSYKSHTLQYGWSVECLTADNKGKEKRYQTSCRINVNVGMKLRNISKETDTSDRCNNVTFCTQSDVCIPIYIQQDATLHSLFYLETALHFSGGTITHYQERKYLYLQHLVFVTPLLLSAAIVEELEPVKVCCGWRTSPTAHFYRFQLTAADSSNGVTNSRWCRYSCMRS
jgi:hypothetical protein